MDKNRDEIPVREQQVVLTDRRKSRSALKKLKKLFNTVRFVTKLKPCFSENYFTVKGAALILPQSDYETAYTRKATKSHGGDIQSHLQSMFSLLRPLDTIKVAVKLEGIHDRYLALVSCIGKQDTEESVILGMDLREETAAIGLIMPVWAHTHIQLDGDGGFSITSSKETHFFKPVSVQAMWSALQSLNKVVKIANDNLYIPGGLTHTWIGFYDSKRSKENHIVSEWIANADIDKSYRTDSSKTDSSEEGSIYKRIKTELKNVMMTVDLEEVTCKFLRESIEKILGMDLREYRHFIDTEMFEILGQMDAPTRIQDYLYLGSEWNASNIEELQNNGVHYILNVSREIDNFFPGILHYMNVREWDIETADLMKHWEDTHRYISRARKKDGKVLVHCKMGISRSASTVIAFLMKENKWSREEAFEFTKEKRSIINPNSGFWKQLETYEGILKARRNWENFNKPGPSGLVPPQESEETMDAEAAFPSTAEDLLAMKLGKDAGEFGDYPFVHSEPDIELSSRSADSTEESLPDERSPQPADGSEDGATGGAFLYPKKKKDKSSSGDFLETDSSDDTESEDISDSDDDNKEGFRPIDVPKIDIQGVSKRKGAKTVGVKKVEARRSKSESDKSSLHVDNKLSGFSREGSVSKFKPDESWIKLHQSDEEELAGEPMDTGQDEENVSTVKQEEDEGLWMGDIKKDVDATEKGGGGDNVAGQADLKEKKNVAGTEKIQTNVTKDLSMNVGTSAIIDDSAETSADKTSVESRAQEQQTKDSIPWSPGKVQRQKQDFENKAFSHRKTDSVGSTDLQILFQSDNVKDSVSVTLSSVDQEAKKETQKATLDAGKDTMTSDTVPKSDTVSRSESEMEVDQTNNAKTDISEESATQNTKMRSRLSVYDLEEIDLPEDFVKKTTQQIEDRLSVDTPRRKLQRSSSLKSKRVTPKAKDRDNERRKTCIAMLSPSNPDFNVSSDITDMKPNSDQSDEEDFSVPPSADIEGADDEKFDETGVIKVYKFKGEELTVQEGLVRKQTMDIEQKAMDIPVKLPSSRPDSEIDYGETMSESVSVSIICSNQSKEAETSSAKTVSSSTISKEMISASAKTNKYVKKDLGASQDIEVPSEKNFSAKSSSVGKESSLISDSSKSASESKIVHATDGKTSVKDSDTIKEKEITSGVVSAKRIDSIKANFQEKDKGALDDKMESDSVGASATPVAARKWGSRKQGSSRFDEETLELIREIGSALMNSPAKTEVEEETEAPLEGGSLVSHYVRNIERRVRGSKKKKTAREIIIVDKDSAEDSTKAGSSQRVSATTPAISCDTKSEIIGPASPKWSPVSRKPASPSSVTSSPETVLTFKGSPAEKHDTMHKPSPSNLTLNLKSDGSPKIEQSAKTDSMAEQDSEAETCSVKNLVGKFEIPSGKTTPVSMNFSCIGSPSSPSPLLPGATQDIEVIEKKDSALPGGLVTSPKSDTTKTFHDTFGGRCLSPKSVKPRAFSDIPSHSAFSRPNQSPGLSGKQQQRQSEPDIHLSERNIQLLDTKLRESGAGLIPPGCIIESEEEDMDSTEDVSVPPGFYIRSRSEDQGIGPRERRARLIGAKAKTSSLGRSETFSESDSPETPMFTWEGKKIRKNYGKSHPLAKLEGTYKGSIRSTPFYSTM